MRENDSIKKHFDAGLKFSLPYQNPSAALPKPHCHCTLKLFNPTCTKAVRPDSGSRNCSRTFPTVVDGQHGICRLGFSIDLGFRVSIGNHSFLDSNAILGFRVLIGN